jgi:predicted transcriptional regulator
VREVIKTQVRIPTDISKAISEIANFRHTSKNSLIIEALRDFLQKEKASSPTTAHEAFITTPNQPSE